MASSSHFPLSSLAMRIKDHKLFGTEKEQLDLMQHTPAFTDKLFRLRSLQQRALFRYSDVIPHEHSRVLLKPIPGETGPHNDFIHANYCELESNLLARCISTQAPVTESIGDFWRMVWQQKSTVIVMLTGLFDGNRQKAHQYWPKVSPSSLLPEVLDVAPFSVVCKSEKTEHGVCVRVLEVTNQIENASLEVTQLQCEAWPDHGVPDESQMKVMEYLFTRFRYLRSQQPLDHTTVVHCSAGIGRTGAFLAIVAVLEQIERGAFKLANLEYDPSQDYSRHVDAPHAVSVLPANWMEQVQISPYKVVEGLRWQRPHMVQSAIQYFFISQFVLHCLESRKVMVLP